MPGTIIGIAIHVPALGVVDHVGLVSDRVGADGYPTVLHASKFTGDVAETTLTTFVRKRVAGARLHVVGYPGPLAPREVLARARAQLGAPYDLLTANCEHFVTGCHGLPPTSPQLDRVAPVAGVLLSLLP